VIFLRKKRVAVVDDYPGIAEVIARYLRWYFRNSSEFDLDVVSYERGLLAQKDFFLNSPDILITDWDLGRSISGRDLCGDYPVIVITSSCVEGTPPASVKKIFQKPVDSGDIAVEVAKLLSSSSW